MNTDEAEEEIIPTFDQLFLYEGEWLTRYEIEDRTKEKGKLPTHVVEAESTKTE